MGYLIGGPSPQVRHSMAIAGPMGNAGLALLIATINRAPPTLEVILISYAITAILVLAAYIRWWAKFRKVTKPVRLTEQSRGFYAQPDPRLTAPYSYSNSARI